MLYILPIPLLSFFLLPPLLPPTLPRKFARHVLSAFMQPTIRWWKVLTGYHSKASAALALTVVGGVVAQVLRTHTVRCYGMMCNASPSKYATSILHFCSRRTISSFTGYSNRHISLSSTTFVAIATQIPIPTNINSHSTAKPKRSLREWAELTTIS